MLRPIQRAFWLVLLTFIGMGLGCPGLFSAWVPAAETHATETPKLIEAQPRDFLVSLDGHPVSLNDCHGQVVILNFWATCVPCRAEMKEIERV